MVEVVQSPFEQTPVPQEFPQEPQSVLEVRRFWQPSTQLVRLPQVELVVQLPLWQESPTGQEKPQPPQFAVEVLRFTQEPLQEVKGLVQVGVVP